MTDAVRHWDFAVRRRQEARDRAWLDHHARLVGYLDAKLHSSRNPYPPDSPQALAWLAGYLLRTSGQEWTAEETT